MLSLTGEKYNFLRSKQLKMREEGLRLMADEAIPLMEEMQDVMKLPPPYEQSLQRMELSAPGSLPAAKPLSDQQPEAEPEATPTTTDSLPELPPFIVDEDAGRTPQ